MTELFTIGRLDYTELEPMTPEQGGWEPVDGDANVRFRTLCLNEQLWAGIAVVQPCKFRYPHDHGGTIQLLEGEATVTCEGRTFDLNAGAAVFFLPGTTSEWVVKTPMREFFVAYMSAESSH